jgi:hypothetical protein
MSFGNMRLITNSNNDIHQLGAGEKRKLTFSDE